MPKPPYYHKCCNPNCYDKGAIIILATNNHGEVRLYRFKRYGSTRKGDLYLDQHGHLHEQQDEESMNWVCPIFELHPGDGLD